MGIENESNFARFSSPRQLWHGYNKIFLYSSRRFEPQEARVVDFMDNNREMLMQFQSGDAEVAVVIPAHDEMHRLARTLAGLNLMLRENPRPVNVVLVDNASSDATAELAEYFGVNVVKEPKKGVGQARQTGLMATNEANQIVLTTDAETVVPADWIGVHEEVLDDVEVVFSGGSVNFMQDTKMSWLRHKIWSSYFVARSVLHYLDGERLQVKVWYGGSNSAFRRQQAIDVGGYRTENKCGEDYFFMLDLLEGHGGRSGRAETEVLSSARRLVTQNLSDRVLASLKFRVGLVVRKRPKDETKSVDYGTFADIRPERDELGL